MASASGTGRLRVVCGFRQVYCNANLEYGVAGDPLRPVEGKDYGYLIHAGSY